MLTPEEQQALNDKLYKVKEEFYKKVKAKNDEAYLQEDYRQRSDAHGYMLWYLHEYSKLLPFKVDLNEISKLTHNECLKLYLEEMNKEHVVALARQVHGFAEALRDFADSVSKNYEHIRPVMNQLRKDVEDQKSSESWKDESLEDDHC